MACTAWVLGLLFTLNATISTFPTTPRHFLPVYVQQTRARAVPTFLTYERTARRARLIKTFLLNEKV